jgi:hypothetical protein
LVQGFSLVITALDSEELIAGAKKQQVPPLGLKPSVGMTAVEG